MAEKKSNGINRTSAGLRNVLFDEIDRLHRGEGDPKQALAIASLAKNIIAIAKLEHEFSKNKDVAVAVPIRLGDTPEEQTEEPRFIAPPTREKLMGGR